MTIAKADYTLENAEQYFAVENVVPYDGGYHTPEPIVDLPAGLSFMSDAAPISNPGESATYNISFAFSDPTLARNYNPPAGISGIKLTIGKAAFDLSAVTFEDATVAYDGGSKKLEVANLPTSLRVTYTYKDAAGATVKGFPVNRGQYTVTATFAFKSAADAALYELPAPLTATLTIGSISLDLDARNAYRGDELVDLTAKEFDVIEFLMRNPNRVYSREALLDTIWAYEYRSDIRTVDVHIRRLREKLELNPAEPQYIMTKWGVGYYFRK